MEEKKIKSQKTKTTMGKLVVFNSTGRGSRANLSNVKPVMIFHKSIISFSAGFLAKFKMNDKTRILLAQDQSRPHEVLMRFDANGKQVERTENGRFVLHRISAISKDITGEYVLIGKSKEHEGWSVLSRVSEDE